MTTTVPFPSAATEVVEAPHDWPAGWAKLALTSYRSNRLPSVDCCAAIAPPSMSVRARMTIRERDFMGGSYTRTPDSQFPTTTNHQPGASLESAGGDL